MLNRTGNPSTFFNQSDNASSFKLYPDGIGYNGYSVRLSNFSLGNVANNFFNLVSLTASLVVSAEAAGVNIGVTGENDRTHYRVTCFAPGSIINEVTEFCPMDLFRLLADGACNVLADRERQNEYDLLQYATIHERTDKLSAYHLFPSLRIDIGRGALEPILVETEQCLKNMVDQYFFSIKEHRDMINAKRAEEVKHFEEMVTPYVCGAALIFGAYKAYRIGSLYYAKYQRNKRRESSTSLNAVSRLEDIGYQGEIDFDFICPISREIMNDPVSANDGKTYDRAAIETWCRQGGGDQNRSPFNENIQIHLDEIRPNDEIRNRIEAFVSEKEREHAERNQPR